MQLASFYERVTRTDWTKRALYDPTDAGVDIASNTLACFSARLGLLPQVRGELPIHLTQGANLSTSCPGWHTVDQDNP